MAYVTSVRLPEVLKDEVLGYAARGGLSFNALVLVALREYLDRRVSRDPASRGVLEVGPLPSVARGTPALPSPATGRPGAQPGAELVGRAVAELVGRAERRRQEKSKAKGKR